MTNTDRRLGVYGSSAFKVPVRAATTASIALSGLQTIDGVALSADDRVLVKDQASGIENGIYAASTGTWERAKDFNGPRDVVQGTLVMVVAGTTNGSGIFSLSTESPVIGTSSLSFTNVVFLSPDSGTSIVQGATLRPYATSTVSSADYSAFPVLAVIPTGRLYCLYYHGRNHGQADAEGVCQSQAVAGAGNLTIDGNEASGGVATSIAGVTARVISTDAADSGVSFTITGEYPLGTAVNAVVTGVTTAAVSTTQKFAKITQVASNGACVGNISVGLNGVPGNICLKTSDDGGYSWSAENVLFDGTTSGLYLYYAQTLGVTASGELVAQCARVTLNDNSVTLVRKKTSQNGTLWGSEETITFTGTVPTGTLNIYGQGKLTPSGKLVFAAYTSTQIFVIVSTDEGATYDRIKVRQTTPAATEPALEILDERRWIIVNRIAAIQKMEQQTSSDGGATWSAGTQLGDLDGNLSNYAYVSPNLCLIERGGTQHLMLLPYPRFANSGVYDYEGSLVAYYGRASSVFADSTAWGLRQVIVDATGGGILLGRSGYPSTVINPISGRLLVAYSEEDGSDTRLNSVKTISVDASSFLTETAGVLGVNRLSINPGAVNTTPLTIGSYSLTGSSTVGLSVINGTWNTSGTPVLMDVNIVDTASNASSIFQRFRKDSVAQYTLYKDGNLDLAGGIKLTNGADRLSTYIKETTWTPTITGSTGGVANTYTAQLGFVTRIGSLVLIFFDCRINGANTATGNLELRGLPYAFKRAVAVSFIESANHSAGVYPQYLSSVVGQKYGTINHITSTSFSAVTDAEVGNDYRISGALWYITDDAP